MSPSREARVPKQADIAASADLIQSSDQWNEGHPSSDSPVKAFRTVKPMVLCLFYCSMDNASLMAQMVKNLPAVQETTVCSLGQEDPLEKGMATSILVWRIPWQAMGNGVTKSQT